MIPMKIDMSLWAAVLIIGADLLGRATVQGVEPALVSGVVEYGSAGVRRLSKWMMRSCMNLDVVPNLQDGNN